MGPDAPFPVALTAPPPCLAWPATVGRNYDVLMANNAGDSFQVSATITATNASGQWLDTAAAAAQRFYRVRTSP
jgi:hypothetical protein